MFFDAAEDNEQARYSDPELVIIRSGCGTATLVGALTADGSLLRFDVNRGNESDMNESKRDKAQPKRSSPDALGFLRLKEILLNLIFGEGSVRVKEHDGREYYCASMTDWERILGRRPTLQG